jgi:hypothetical protein
MLLLLESSSWLLRSCGAHEHAIVVSYKHLQQQRQQPQQLLLSSVTTTDGGGGSVIRGYW